VKIVHVGALVWYPLKDFPEDDRLANDSQQAGVSRRDFLKTSGLALSGCLLPLFHSSSPGLAAEARQRRVLVMLQLNGGNDGFNTLVNYNSDWYYHARPRLAVARHTVLPLNDEIAFSQPLLELHQLYLDGNLAVLPSVGYPNMSRSHFRSTDVWHSAICDRLETTGWLGRYIKSSVDSHGSAVGETIVPTVFAGTDRLTLNSEVSSQSLAEKLRRVAVEIKKQSADVFFVSLDGFDTHEDQNGVHPGLLREVSVALDAFQRSLQQERIDEDVVTVVFSEFGRRLHENAHGGTDHGAGAPVFVLGSKVNGGIYGDRLHVPDSADLTYDTDFRQLYATILDRWLHSDSEKILGQKYASLTLMG